MDALPLSALSARERDIVVTVATWLFPDGPHLAVPGVEDRVAAYVDDYASRLPTPERLQLRGLIHAIDRGFAPWSGRPAASLVSARPGERATYLASWPKASTYTQRMLFEGLRTVLMMGFAADPVVRELVGVPMPGTDTP